VRGHISEYMPHSSRTAAIFKDGSIDVNAMLTFLRATAVPAGTSEARISYGDSVRLSVWGVTIFWLILAILGCNTHFTNELRRNHSR